LKYKKKKKKKKKKCPPPPPPPPPPLQTITILILERGLKRQDHESFYSGFFRQL